MNEKNDTLLKYRNFAFYKSYTNEYSWLNASKRLNLPQADSEINPSIPSPTPPGDRVSTNKDWIEPKLFKAS